MQEQSDLDIIMNTGAGSPFYNCQSFKDFIMAQKAKNEGKIQAAGRYKDWFFKQPTYYR